MSKPIRPPFLQALGLGLIVLILVVVISIPVVRRVHRQNERQRITETLSMIMLAKTRLAVAQTLDTGAPVTMEELIEHGEVLTEAPLDPAGGRYIIEPIGSLPRFVREKDNLDITLESPTRVNSS